MFEIKWRHNSEVRCRALFVKQAKRHDLHKTMPIHATDTLLWSCLINIQISSFLGQWLGGRSKQTKNPRSLRQIHLLTGKWWVYNYVVVLVHNNWLLCGHLKQKLNMSSARTAEGVRVDQRTAEHVSMEARALKCKQGQRTNRLCWCYCSGWWVVL